LPSGEVVTDHVDYVGEGLRSGGGGAGDPFTVRHGHVPGISPERFRGRAEIEMTERGHVEARQTADWIARWWHPTIVYTSPMKRCRDTAKEIATRCGVSVEVLDDLNDLNYGNWQWQTNDTIAADSPALYRRWRTTPHLMRFPNGESFQELIARAADALRRAMEKRLVDRPSPTIFSGRHGSRELSRFSGRRVPALQADNSWSWQ
jgi:hypothetical protein